MITINYCKEGVPISDFFAEEWVKEVIEKKDKNREYKVSTSIAVNIIHREIVKEVLSYEEVQFVFFGEQVVKANKKGYFPCGGRYPIEIVLSQIIQNDIIRGQGRLGYKYKDMSIFEKGII